MPVLSQLVLARTLVWIAVVALLPLHSARTQTRPQIIRGRVTADSTTAPVAGANVVVTVAPTAEVLATHTDSTGGYRIVIANPTGEYVLNVNLIGWRAFKQRVNVAPPDSVATVNVKLFQIPQTLATTVVQATHPRPPRGDALSRNPDVNGANKIVDGVTNALSPDLQGNIDAMASLIPGLTPTAGGYSAFGLGPDANMKTLNGMQFTGDALPRDLATTTTFSSSPWDPTRGGFSGGFSSTTVASGSNIFSRRGRLTLDAPSLQVTDPVAARFGQRFTNVQAGGSNSGAFALDRYFYDAGYQASLNRAPLSSLLDVDAGALEHAAIAPDSAFRLVRLLQAEHVPLTRGDIPDERTTASATVAARFDHTLPSVGPGATPPPQWNVTTGGTYAKTYGQSLSPLAPPATSGRSVRDNAYVQGLYSRFFGAYGSYVNETAANVSFNESKGTPYFALPGGSVLIASSLADGTPTFGTVSFGGNGALASDTRQTAFELNNRTNLLLRDKLSLPATIYLQSRYEHYDQSISANRAGAFSFASLGDLANNAPSSFTRTLNTPDRSGGEWMGAAAMGFNWNTQKLVITGGPRLDMNAFDGVPARNPEPRARVRPSQRSRAQLGRVQPARRLQLVLQGRSGSQRQRVAGLARLPERAPDPRRLRRVPQQPAQRFAGRRDRRDGIAGQQRASRLHWTGHADSRLADVCRRPVQRPDDLRQRRRRLRRHRAERHRPRPILYAVALLAQHARMDQHHTRQLFRNRWILYT